MISKDEAKDIVHKLRGCMQNEACELMDCAYFHNYEELGKLLEYVENSSPIVRCMNCKWCKGGKNGQDSWKECTLANQNRDVFDVFFCFRGEPKDEQKSEGNDYDLWDRILKK